MRVAGIFAFMPCSGVNIKIPATLIQQISMVWLTASVDMIDIASGCAKSRMYKSFWHNRLQCQS